MPLFLAQFAQDQVRRTGLAAEVLARSGFITLVSAAPCEDSRAAVRRRHEATGTRYVEFHLDAPSPVDTDPYEFSVLAPECSSRRRSER